MSNITPTPRYQNGAAIRAIRKRSGLSVRTMCNRLAELGIEIHPNSFRNVETGARGASEELVAAIARVLVVDQAAILAAPAEPESVQVPA